MLACAHTTKARLQQHAVRKITGFLDVLKKHHADARGALDVMNQNKVEGDTTRTNTHTREFRQMHIHPQ